MLIRAVPASRSSLAVAAVMTAHLDHRTRTNNSYSSPNPTHRPCCCSFPSRSSSSSTAGSAPARPRAGTRASERAWRSASTDDGEGRALAALLLQQRSESKGTPPAQQFTFVCTSDRATLHARDVYKRKNTTTTTIRQLRLHRRSISFLSGQTRRSTSPSIPLTRPLHTPYRHQNSHTLSYASSGLRSSTASCAAPPSEPSPVRIHTYRYVCTRTWIRWDD